jgi:hypothetical protein
MRDGDATKESDAANSNHRYYNACHDRRTANVVFGPGIDAYYAKPIHAREQLAQYSPQPWPLAR